MNIFQRVKGVINTFLWARVKDEFEIKPLNKTDVDSYINECIRIYEGKPEWQVDDIRTVNFAKTICGEVARLATLGISVKMGESERGQWLQKQFDKDVYYQLRNWIEYGCAMGTVILKPNGEGVDFITPDNFVITEYKNGQVTGAVFEDKSYDAEEEKWYTKLEYHRFDGDKYLVSNRCTVSKSENDAKGKPVAIENTPWAGLQDEAAFEGIDRPLFAVFKTPNSNNIDVRSPMALPIFADAIEELRDVDIAYTRMAKEIDDSRRIVLMDSDRLMITPGRNNMSIENQNVMKEKMQLPEYVKMVSGTGDGDIYHEINPSINTTLRLEGINAILGQIGYKCGFSNGYFVFNAKTGLATATQVEAEQQRTIQLIKDVRDRLEDCLNGLIYSMSAFADFYDLAPSGDYDVNYSFGDITYNYEEDRARWLSYVQLGKIEFWRYLTKFEGFTEEEAKEIAQEAIQSQMQNTLFGNMAGGNEE